jgi:predicted permease
MTNLTQDLRRGLRVFRRSPGFAAAAIATLAIGIGATTAIFSVAYGVLLRPLPYSGEGRLVDVAEVNARGRSMHVADPNFADFRDQSRTIESLAEYSAWDRAVATPDEALRTGVATVSRGFFDALRVRPLRGRPFLPEELTEGSAPVALVSYDFWRSHLGARSDFSSRPVRLDGIPHTVVGVLPEGFHFPDESRLWVARERFPFLTSRTAHNSRLIGRLRPGVDLGAARAELSSIARRLASTYGKDTDAVDAAVTPLKEIIVGKVRPALLLLLAAAVSLFLVACVDVVSLLLARAAARRREIAVRRALGAGRFDLIQTFLSEALAIAIPGGAAGVGVAFVLVKTLARLAPADLPRLSEVSVDGPVLAAALLLSLIAAACLAVVTASSESGSKLAETLRGSQSSGNVSTRRAQRTLAAGQLAITVLLLAGVGLLARSLTKLLEVPYGFRPDHVLAMTQYLPDASSDSDKRRRIASLDALLARLRPLPGVEEVGATNHLPLADGLENGTFLVMRPGEGLPDPRSFERLFKDPARTGSANYCLATGGYFLSMKIPLLRGRLFTESDGPDAPHAAVVNEALARERWPGGDAIGQQIEFGNMDGDLRVMTVVGIVGDVRAERLEDSPARIIYGNLRQRQKNSDRTVTLRTTGAPAAVAATVRQAAHELDPQTPLTIRSMQDVVDSSVAARRLGILLLSLFGGAALALACTGLAGITAYAISQRRREMGIRTALGARPAALLKLLVSEQSRVIAAGLAIGLAGSVLFGRVARAMLFGIEPADPAALLAASALLTAGAFLAVLVPGMRVLKLEAAEVLRSE